MYFEAQGQTLKNVGLFLPNPVFSHGQLYVAMSRVSKPEDIVIYIDETSNKHGVFRKRTYTKNIVFHQLLVNERHKFKKNENYMGENPKFSDVVDYVDEDSDVEDFENRRNKRQRYNGNFDDEHMELDFGDREIHQTEGDEMEIDAFEDFEMSESPDIDDEFERKAVDQENREIAWLLRSQCDHYDAPDEVKDDESDDDLEDKGRENVCLACGTPASVGCTCGEDC